MSTDYGQETLLASALRKLAAEKAAAAPYKPGPSLTQRNYGLGSGLNPALGKQPLQGSPQPAAAPQMPQGSVSNQDVRKHFSGYKGPASFGVPRHVIESMRQADRSNGGKGEITWSSDNVPMIPGLPANDPRNDPRTYAQQPTIPTPNELRNQQFLAGERAALADPNREAELQAEERRMNLEMQQKAQATNARALAQTETPAQPVATAPAAAGGGRARGMGTQPAPAAVSMNQADAGPLGWDAPLEYDPAGGFVDAMGGAADDALGTIGGMALNNFGPLSAIGKSAPAWGAAGKAMLDGMQQSKSPSRLKTGMLKEAISTPVLGRLARMAGPAGVGTAAAGALYGAHSLGQNIRDNPDNFAKGFWSAADYLGGTAAGTANGVASIPGVAAAVIDQAQDLGSKGLGLLSPNKGVQPAGEPQAKPTILDQVKTPDGSSLLGRFPIPVRDSFANMAATKGPEAVRSALQAQADVTPELGYDKQQYDRKLYNTLAPLFGYDRWEADKPTGAVDPEALAKSTLERVDNPMKSTVNDYLQAARNNPYATGAAGVGALGLGSLLASGRKAPEEESIAPRKRKKRKPATKTAADPREAMKAVLDLSLADPQASRAAIKGEQAVDPNQGYDKQQYDRKLYNTFAPLFGGKKWEVEPLKAPAGLRETISAPGVTGSPDFLVRAARRLNNPLQRGVEDYASAAYNNPYTTGLTVGLPASVLLGAGLAGRAGAADREERDDEQAETQSALLQRKSAAKGDPPPYFGFAAAGVGALGLADTLRRKMRRKKKVKEESPETEEYVIERKVAALLG